MLLPVLMALCAVALVLFFLLLPGESDTAMRSPFWGVNFAHRGLHSQDKSVPENSLAAFTAAIDGEYGIELDVRLTKDGQVVVFHDDTLDRMCGVPGRVDSFTWEQLQEYRLLETEHGIPLLWDVLDLVDGRIPLLIELKMAPGAQRRALCEKTWKILRTYDGDICIESFDPRMVRWFKRHVPGLLRGQLAAHPGAMAKASPIGVVVGLGLANCLGRPHFIAYQYGKKPLTIKLAERFCMRFAWTLRSQEQGDAAEDVNEGVIFEFYQPLPRFAQPPGEPENAPDPDEPYRF